jgi:hypothetical protein
MLSRLRDPGGGPSLLMAGLACLGLAAMLAAALGPLGMLLGAAVAIAGLVFLALAWKRQRETRYDLGRLFDAPEPEPEEPYEDTVPHESAPYCGWCDEAYPPGTRRCHRCGREL